MMAQKHMVGHISLIINLDIKLYCNYEFSNPTSQHLTKTPQNSCYKWMEENLH